MWQDKTLRRREIEILIERGRYDDAEALLKESVVPNTKALQQRIDDLRRAAQPVPAKPAPRQRLKRILYTLLIVAVIAVGVALLLPLASSRLQFYILIGFIFFIPLLYLSFARRDRQDRYLNRSRYQRPGFGPRRQ